MSGRLPFGTIYQEIPLLNNKGDIITYDDVTSTTFILPLGANGNVLTANNTLDAGINWTVPAGGITLINKGDLLSHDGTTENILSVDPNNEYILRVDPMATDGIKWDSVNTILPSKSKGDLITNDGITSVALSVGVNGQILVADSTATEGVKWDDVKDNTLLTTKGDVLTHDATSSVRLGVGSNGQILVADSTDVNGIIWVDNVSVPLTTKGDVLSNDGSMNERLGVGTDGQFLTADSSETTGLKWTTSSSSPILTTKGDLLGYDTDTVRIPVGSNGQILVADSSTAEGVDWEDIKDNTVLTTKGDVMTSNGTNALRLAIGTDTQLLVADSSTSEGLSWKDVADVIGSSNITWREPVIDKLTTPPGGPSIGDRYVVLPVGTGLWTGQDNDVAEWNGVTWDFNTPSEGWALWDETADELCVYTGAAWVKLGFTIDHFNLQNIGINTHVQIDSHISDTSNPHSVTLNQVTVATTKGDLLAYTGATSTRLPVGTNDQILIADSAQADGIKWGGTLSTLGATIKSDIITGNGASTIIFSGSPANGQILSALSTETSGLLWINNTNLTLTTKGDLLSRSAGAEVRLGVGTNGQVLVANSAITEGINWSDVKDNTVLTTKGDVMTSNGTNALRLGVGTNGQVLVANSATTEGINWSDVKDNTVLTTKGDIMTDNGTSSVRLGVGNRRQILVADDNATNGIEWDYDSWQQPILNQQTTPPGGPATDDRYIVTSVATGAWTGQEDDIAEWNGTSWDFTTPLEGWSTYDGAANEFYVFNGVAWVALGTTVTMDQVTVATTKGDLIGYTGGTSARLGIGTNGQVLTAASGESTGLIWAASGGGSGATTWSFFHSTAAGTGGGMTTTLAWTTRPLNLADTSNAAGITLSANQITIASAGKYRFEMFQSFGSIDETQIRLRNITSGTTIQGSTASNKLSSPTHLASCCLATVAASDVLELQYYTESDDSSDSLGYSNPVAAAEINIFATINITEAS